MAMLVKCQQGTPEWHKARAGAITASRFSLARTKVDGLTAQQAKYVNAMLGGATEAAARELAGYKGKPSAGVIDMALAGAPVGRPSDGAMSYARLLAAERISGEALDDVYQTYAMRRGTELEPVARQLYMERTGQIVEESGFLISDDGLFGYSTDGEVYGECGGIEIKCPNAADKVCGVWLDPEPILAEYLDQCDGGMWLSNWRWIDLVVFTPWLASVGKDLFICRIHRDEDRVGTLVEDLVAFARLVNKVESDLRGVEPPPLSSPPPWVGMDFAATPAPPPKPPPLVELATPDF